MTSRAYQAASSLHVNFFYGRTGRALGWQLRAWTM